MNYNEVIMETSSQATFRSSRHIRKSLKEKHKARRSLAEKIADTLTSFFGTPHFLLFNIIFFVFWLLINAEIISVIKPIDPFPFILLTTLVSLEAIILSIFVLITQNRAAKIDDLREEIDLQVDEIAEKELTKVLQLQTVILKKLGIDSSNDKELQEMLKPLDESKIEKSLEKQV